MRAATVNTDRRTGMQSSTTQATESPKVAPATVAVSTAAGSRSAAPAMIPGISRSRLESALEPAPSIAETNGTTLPRSAASPLLGLVASLRNLGKLTLEVLFDLALVLEAER